MNQACPMCGHNNDKCNASNLLDSAKLVIEASCKASAAILQKHLRISFAKASELLTELEEESFVSPTNGNKPREIL